MENKWVTYCNCGFGSEYAVCQGEVMYCSICNNEIIVPEVKARLLEEKKITQKVKKTKDIHIVDDQAFVRQMFIYILTNNGYRVEQVESGLEAIKHIIHLKNINNTMPLIILDISMPGLLNGIQTLGVLSTIQEDIEVFVVTSLPPNNELIADLKKYGAKKYLNKSAKSFDKLLLENIE
ncbi:MAG: response regulator [bacterium]